MCRRSHGITPAAGFLLFGAVSLAVMAGTVGASLRAEETHTLQAAVVSRTCDEGFRGSVQVGGIWTDRGRTHGNVTWLAFDIPEWEGYVLTRATLDIGPIAQLNHPWDAGIRVHYVANDAWTSETIQPDWSVTEVVVSNRNASDQGKTSTGRVSTDITPWLSFAGEGMGRRLSLCLTRTGGGLRGWRLREPTTLTVTTERLLTFGPPRHPPSGDGGVAVRSALETVFAEDAPVAQDTPLMSLTVARRESESAQVAIVAGSESQRVTDVTASELRTGEDVISASNIALNVVGYVTVRKPSWRGLARPGLWPDVLMPMRPFDVPSGMCRLVWVTVSVPPGTEAGNYRGQLRVTYAARDPVTIPLECRVWDFSLPASPALRTSYWTAMGHAYPGGLQDAARARQLHDLFSAYRTSTDTWGGIRFYRETDGEITVDWADTKRNMAYAAGHAGFNTLNVSSGCWGTSPFGRGAAVYDRETGEPLSEKEREKALADIDLMALYLNQVCDWLQSKGWLERAYMQLWDEPKRNTWGYGCKRAYPVVRDKEPRLDLLCVAGVHPELQGLFDIWVPHVAFYDRDVYEYVRQGVRLAGKKTIPATVSASSTGGWKTGAFYTYRAIDAYDGCDYTKWVPAEEPTDKGPQWLRFDFAGARPVKGLRVAPYRRSQQGRLAFTVEVSADGDRFVDAALSPIDTTDHAWSFDAGPIRSVRLVFEALPASFTPTDRQPVAFPETWGAGVREVEFLCEGEPVEADLSRPMDQRPCELWEYNVGADWPSVCIDAQPHEHRATGWLMWIHGSRGYLNYGGGQWKRSVKNLDEALGQTPPLIWRASGNGGPNITWPSRTGVLASIRFARFRDGIDDYDYLTLMERRRPDHPLLAALREGGLATARSSRALATARERLALALEGTDEQD